MLEGQTMWRDDYDREEHSGHRARGGEWEREREQDEYRSRGREQESTRRGRHESEDRWPEDRGRRGGRSGSEAYRDEGREGRSGREGYGASSGAPFTNQADGGGARGSRGFEGSGGGLGAEDRGGRWAGGTPSGPYRDYGPTMGDYGNDPAAQFGRERSGFGSTYGQGAQGWRGGASGSQGSMAPDRSNQLYGSENFYSPGQRQDFTGRGPKAWKRSDQRIEEDLNEQLTRHRDIDATEIEVKVQNGEVTLSGTVTDRQSKRLAEDIAENVSGVHNVQNQIRVSQQGSSYGTSPQGGDAKSKGSKTTM